MIKIPSVCFVLWNDSLMRKLEWLHINFLCQPSCLSESWERREWKEIESLAQPLNMIRRSGIVNWLTDISKCFQNSNTFHEMPASFCGHSCESLSASWEQALPTSKERELKRRGVGVRYLRPLGELMSQWEIWQWSCCSDPCVFLFFFQYKLPFILFFSLYRTLLWLGLYFLKVWFLIVYWLDW